MNIFRRSQRELRTISSAAYSQLRNSTSVASQQESVSITVPKRIPRGPTDILKALASTVREDLTAPHYKYHDDPYFIPMSNVGKRTFALAKESGRKAAKWVRDQHPDFFQHRVADPPIKDFFPMETFNENSNVTEDILSSLIEDCRVTDAMTVFQLLQNKSESISPSTKQSLLELLCFFNCEDAYPEDLIEENWFRQGPRGHARQRKTWKDNGLAEQVFRSFEPPTAAAYCSLIQGMTRFHQVERAWQLYEEMLGKGLPLTVETYNSLIRVCNFLRESSDLRWKLIQELLTSMAKQGLKPNVGTLNAALEVVSSMTVQKLSKTYALNILSEFRNIDVTPSLATYYYLLIIFCKERGPISSVLIDIIDHIEGKEFEIQDPKDTFFFTTAMDVCRNHLQDKDLAYRVDKLLHTGNNYNLIGDSYKESIYYRHYFSLLSVTESFEIFMDVYKKLVPHIYIPEPSVMQEVIKAVDLSGSIDHFPQVWSDMVAFDHVDRENLVNSLLESMSRNVPPKNSPVAQKFAEVAWSIYNKYGEKLELRPVMSWTGQMLGNIIILCLCGQEYERAYEILNKLYKQQHKIVGLPDVTPLKMFLDACIETGDGEKALACIRFCADACYPETENMGLYMKEKMKLDASQLSRLANILNIELPQSIPTTAEVA